MEALFEQLKSLGWEDEDIPLALDSEIEKIEDDLGIILPITYKVFAKKYLNIGLRGIQFLPLDASAPTYLLTELSNARKYFDLPNNLIPFINDNSDYFCFDTNTTAPDYMVKYWSHNGTTDEKWDNFLDWVENCWIKESIR